MDISPKSTRQDSNLSLNLVLDRLHQKPLQQQSPSQHLFSQELQQTQRLQAQAQQKQM